jgi:hypothetical protein
LENIIATFEKIISDVFVECTAFKQEFYCHIDVENDAVCSSNRSEGTILKRDLGAYIEANSLRYFISGFGSYCYCSVASPEGLAYVRKFLSNSTTWTKERKALFLSVFDTMPQNNVIGALAWLMLSMLDFSGILPLRLCLVYLLVYVATGKDGLHEGWTKSDVFRELFDEKVLKFFDISLTNVCRVKVFQPNI